MTIVSQKAIIVIEASNSPAALITALEDAPPNARLIEVDTSQRVRYRQADGSPLEYGTVQMTFELEQAS